MVYQFARTGQPVRGRPPENDGEPYSITSSACVRNAGGSARSSAFAAPRLTISLKVVA
jgi:hypothetical protein